MDGFKLACKGIIGDGCGGGRTFYIENEKLFVFDPVTKSSQVLLENVHDALAIEKNGCDIFITTKKGKTVFNLSSFTATIL